MAVKYNKKELQFLAKHSSKDATRLHLNCVHFDNAAGVAVATDGHRLGMKHAKPWDDEPQVPPVNIPRAEVEAIAKGLDATQTASFTIAGVTVWNADTVVYERPCKVADVKFPPYRQVLPTSFPIKTGVVGINAAYLKDAAVVAQLANSSRGLGVEIVTAGELDPVTICAGGAGGTFAVIIMPMRLGGHESQRESRFFDMMAEIQAAESVEAEPEYKPEFEELAAE